MYNALGNESVRCTFILLFMVHIQTFDKGTICCYLSSAFRMVKLAHSLYWDVFFLYVDCKKVMMNFWDAFILYASDTLPSVVDF